MKIIERIIVSIFVILIGFYIFGIIDNEFGKQFNCKEYKTIYYRNVGTGGLFGGILQVETTKSLADGTKQICKEWDGYILKFNGGSSK